MYKSFFLLLSSFVSFVGLVMGTAEGYGEKFGTEFNNYTKGRKGYGESVYAYLKEIIAENASILDVGCGTGIATRELYLHGFHDIQGCDVDPMMVQEANRCNAELNLPFTIKVAGVLDLPEVFFDKEFDVITAFTCFHWFCNQEAIAAIKSKLKPEGLLIIVWSTRAYKDPVVTNEFRALIENISGNPFLDPMSNFNPKEMLEKSGFLVDSRSWSHEESSSYEEALARLQSLSCWCALTDEQKIQGLPLMEQFVKANREAFLFRTVKVNCLVAKPTL